MYVQYWKNIHAKSYNKCNTLVHYTLLDQMAINSNYWAPRISSDLSMISPNFVFSKKPLLRANNHSFFPWSTSKK